MKSYCKKLWFQTPGCRAFINISGEDNDDSRWKKMMLVKIIDK